MNLLDKRFRSKTSSAAHLLPVRLVLSLSKSFSSLNYANYDTVSLAKGDTSVQTNVSSLEADRLVAKAGTLASDEENGVSELKREDSLTPIESKK